MIVARQLPGLVRSETPEERPARWRLEQLGHAPRECQAVDLGHVLVQHSRHRQSRGQIDGVHSYDAPMIISNSKKFSFLHVHKTGGTSMEIGLSPFLSWNDIVLGSSDIGIALNAPYKKAFGLSKHSGIGDIYRSGARDTIADYYIFATVREPASRTCSLYNYVGWLVQQGSISLGLDQDELRTYIDAGITASTPAPWLKYSSVAAYLLTRDFSEFIRHPRLAKDKAFWPQVDSFTLTDGGDVIPELFKIEETSSWICQIQDRLNIPFILPWVNSTPLRLVDIGQIGSNDLKFIQDRFVKDYAILGY